jgi:membrane-associated two-gene conflict system component 1 (EACC1)
MSTPLQLSVEIDDATPEELASITRELHTWITNTVPEVRTSFPAAAPPRPGDKGVEIEIGTLVLAFINAGAATALVNCLMTYIKERRRTVKLEVKDASGRAVSLDAANIGSAEVDGILRRMSELSRGPEAPLTAASPGSGS